MNRNTFDFFSIRKLAKSEITYILIIIAIWILMAIIVNPIGDFPLNDDWAFGRAVKSVVEKGEFKLSDWGAMNLFSQVWWGALFCLPFGFSFTVLRLSTLVLGLIGVLATYGLLRETNPSPKVALLGALLILVNPIYFSLSNTFMTDVPFFTFATISLYFLIRGLKYNSILEIFIGIIISCITLLIRQLGIAIFLAFGCAYVIKKGLNTRNIIQGFSPSLLGFSLQFFYQKWLSETNRLPASFGLQIKNSLKVLNVGFDQTLLHFITNSQIALIYFGLFSFPLIVIIFPLKVKEFSFRYRSLILFSLSIVSILEIAYLVSQHKKMSLSSNILGYFGIGPLTVQDAFFNLTSFSYPTTLTIFWWILTIIGVVASNLFIFYFFFAIRRLFFSFRSFKSDKIWLEIFIISVSFIYFFPLGLDSFFDRYLLILIPLSMIFLLIFTKNINPRRISIATLSLFLVMVLPSGILTIGATHDYLSWNRVRWQALHNLMQEPQISPNDIDGGFEFNGWYLYDYKYKKVLTKVGGGSIKMTT
jgi:hypothetical protein